jgi:hypothetical protein
MTIRPTLKHPRPDIRRVGKPVGRPVELDGVQYVRRNTRNGVRWFTVDTRRAIVSLVGETVDTLIVTEVCHPQLLRRLRHAVRGEIDPTLSDRLRRELARRDA